MAQAIEQLRERVASAKTELVRAEERLKQEKDNLVKVVEEIKDAGCTPKTIDATIDKLETDLKAETKRLTDQVEEIEDALADDGPRIQESRDDSGVAETIDGLNFDD